MVKGAARSIRKIISGGQTGADRAALDVAIELGIEHGGWVPSGRRAEDGTLDPRYHVRETSSARHAVRTEANVREADATLILSHGPLAGGSALTFRLAQRYGKPVLHIDFSAKTLPKALQEVRLWLRKLQPEVLNVAGPRKSNDEQIYERAHSFLTRLLRTRRRPK